MTAPRLEISLDKIQHNARTLGQKLARNGITVTGVTKAFHGCPRIARAITSAGIKAHGDSRIDNI